ncbi:MAG TPA: DUF1549 and DUF1553 domain-containing protein, partial [Urbifossiella sp.]
MPLRLLCTLLLLATLLPATYADDTWWAFLPLQRPALPRAQKTKPSNPIDCFVQAKLAEKGLSPAPEADKRTLIRRLTFDLIGLPPTPEEIDAFLKDDSPGAYEKLVDRLLASPHFGERAARQWMDLVHFAETHGHDQDRVRPNAWRCRDYLIRSFNADTPYARFVREQIAADVLYPEQPELIPALGFLSAGPWDESSLRDIREDTIDREIGRYLDRDDMVTTVMNTFQGLTVQCARCHDHKFDPISQLDYYRLQAVFAGVGRGDVSYETDPAMAKKRRELKDALDLASRTPSGVGFIETPEFKKTVATWEVRHRGEVVSWQTFDFAKIQSQHGSTLTKQADGSVRSEGARPERDTYTLTVRMKPKGITAVRLELLSDNSLPHKGPGRQDNGNLHLSEFSLTANAKAIALRNPTSDYDQPGWTVAHTLDGNLQTAWGIYPQVGRSHEAVYELKQPLDGASDTELSFKLEQLHGGGHLIGRFRLSWTDAAIPVKVGAVSPAIRAILATPSEKRTPQQSRELALHVFREQTEAALAALPPAQIVYAASSNFKADGSHRPSAMPRPVHMLKRGDIRKPGELVEPGSVSCVPGLPEKFELPANHAEGARRAALAKWITDPKNPLTWRVIVNRIWQMHFGQGLVGTPSDFGKMGQAPTHPELLDWLAAEFLASRDRKGGGGSLKQLHKLIVMSSTYRQASVHNAKAAAIDADNHLLWRAHRSRLDAEQIRDAVLLI